MNRIAPCLLSLLVFAACATPSIEGMHEDMYRDLLKGHGSGSFRDAVQTRQDRRLERVRSYWEEGQLETGEDHRLAADILVKSNAVADIELALEIAQTGAEMGDDFSKSVIGTATDRLLMIRDKLPQKYGTQIVWEVVLDKWRLYAVDPATTDADRAAMYLPTLEEQKSRVALLNASDHMARMREAN